MPIRRIGFIGIGAIARHHARAAKAAEAEIVALCARQGIRSPRLPAFMQAAGRSPSDTSIPCHTSISDVFEAPGLEGVVVALPWHILPAVLPSVLRTDIPALLEKPVALHSRALRFAMTQGDRAQVGFNRRFYEPVLSLKNRLQAGGLLYAEVRISEWLNHHAEVTGVAVLPYLLQYTSCHLLDLALWLFGEMYVSDVSARQTSSDFVAYQALLYREPSETPVFLHINSDEPTAVGIRCVFDDCTVWALQPVEKLTVYQGIEIEEATEGRPFRTFRPRVLQEESANQDIKPGFAGQMRAFLSGGGNGAARLHDAMRVLELIETLADRGGLSA